MRRCATSIAFFREREADAAGTANPVAGAIKNTIGSGVSQCGNFMKTFLHLGFNQDAATASKVFDGVYAQIAARQTNLNTRFAMPGGGGGVRTDHTAFGQAGTRGLDAGLRRRRRAAAARRHHEALRGDRHLPEALPRLQRHRVLGRCRARRC